MGLPKHPALRGYLEKHLNSAQPLKGKAKKALGRVTTELGKKPPSPKRLKRLFENPFMVRNYHRVKNVDVYESLVNSIIHYGKFTPKDNLLFVGSGTALEETFFAKHVVPEGKVTCLDFSQAMSKEGKKFSSSQDAKNMSFVTASGFNIPVQKHSQNAVIAIESVMPSYAEWNNFLAEAKRILKPNPKSKLIFTTAVPEKGLKQVSEEMTNQLKANGFRFSTIVGYSILPNTKKGLVYFLMVIASP